MKKLLCIIMAAAMVITLAACGNTQKTDETAAQTEAVSESQKPTETTVTEKETKAVRDPDAVYEYETREIWCENNGNRIYGVAYIPIIEGVSKFPLVIHSHGLGSNHEAGEGFCKRYAEKGFAGYTFDFPGGSKPSNENRSDGDPMQMSAVTEASDLQKILDTALTWDFVDKDYVFLEGGSQGGLVSTMVALDNKDKVRGMILMYPALTMAEAVSGRYSSPEDVPQTISFGDDYQLGSKFVTDLFGVEVMSRLNTFDGNVIMIHGSDDKLVSVSVSEQALKLFPNAELHVIEGAGHGFGGDDFDKAAEFAIDYLFKNT